MSFSLEEIIRPLGLTLLDSLWQGAIVLLVCGGLLWLLRHKSSRIRHYVVLCGLFTLPLLAIFTFTQYYQPAQAYEENFPGIVSYKLPTYLPTQDISLPELSLLDQWHHWAQSNADHICFFWLIGFVLFGIRLSGGFYMIHRLKTKANLPLDSIWVDKLSEMSAHLKLKVEVRLLESLKVSSPIVLGYLKPIIIFPVGLLQGLPTDQIEAILLHELAHIKRHDYLLNVLVSVLQLFFFYHPAYWWLQGQLDSEREYSCDDLVISQTGNSLSLIKALTAVKEFQLTRYTPSMAFAGQKNQLLKRVERIMQKKTRTNWLGGLISMSVLLLSFFLMSYQTRQQTSETVTATEGQVTDSLSFISQNFELPAYAEDSISSASLQMLQSGPITLEQATMDLIDPKKSGLYIVTDDQDNLILLKKHGKKVEGKELEIYLQAYNNLKQYVLKQQVILKNQETIKKEYDDQLKHNRLQENLKTQYDLISRYREEFEARKKVYTEQLMYLSDKIMATSANDSQNKKLAEALEAQKKALSQQKQALRNQEVLMSEMNLLRKEMENTANSSSEVTLQNQIERARRLRARMQELFQYQEQLLDEQSKISMSQGLKELLKYHPDFIEELKTLDLNKLKDEEVIKVELMSSTDTEQKVLKVFEISVKDIRELEFDDSRLHKPASAQGLQAQEIAELRKKIQIELEVLRQKEVANGKYTYTEHDNAQHHLVSTISMASAVADRPLIVVDGTVREEWNYKDLNQIDENRIIKSLTVQSADKVTDPAYTSLMADRNALILIETASGGKKFKRPKLYEGQMKILSADEVVQQKEELFTKKAVEKLQSEGLLENDWSSFSISQDEFFIDGKEQSKKTHRKYLKLYKQMVGKSFPPVALVWIND